MVTCLELSPLFPAALTRWEGWSLGTQQRRGTSVVCLMKLLGWRKVSSFPQRHQSDPEICFRTAWGNVSEDLLNCKYRLKWYWKDPGHILPGTLWRLGKNDFFQQDGSAGWKEGEERRCRTPSSVPPGNKRRCPQAADTASRVRSTLAAEGCWHIAEEL